MSNIVHECIRFPLQFSLTNDGKLLVRNLNTGAEGVFPWFMDERGKPWMVKKLKGFKGLVAQADRDGDYDDMKIKKEE